MCFFFFLNLLIYLFKKKNLMYLEINLDLWKIVEDIMVKFCNCVVKCINMIYKLYI